MRPAANPHDGQNARQVLKSAMANASSSYSKLLLFNDEHPEDLVGGHLHLARVGTVFPQHVQLDERQKTWQLRP